MNPYIENINNSVVVVQRHFNTLIDLHKNGNHSFFCIILLHLIKFVKGDISDIITTPIDNAFKIL